MPSPRFWANAAFAMDLPVMFFGLKALVTPASALVGAGLPSGTTAADQSLAKGLMRIYGVRNVVIGLTLAQFWYRGHREAQGTLMLVMALMPVVDGFAFKEAIGGGQWQHWAFIPFIAAPGAGLLGWLG
ncbi:hypothetical protein PG987_006623 [Apiospora arundinis]